MKLILEKSATFRVPLDYRDQALENPSTGNRQGHAELASQKEAVNMTFQIDI